MSKLHKKMVAMGDMSQYSYDDIVAACGEPAQTSAFTFTDVGEGTRCLWKDGLFSIGFNFGPDGRYCGMYHHRNLEPWVAMGLLSAAIIIAALIYGAVVRGRSAGTELTKASARILLEEHMAEWKTEDTAGLSFFDLNGDETPELLAVDTEFGPSAVVDGDYFSDCTVRVFTLSAQGLSPAGSFSCDDYCFLAELTGSAGGWYCLYGGEYSLLGLTDGTLTVTPGQPPAGADSMRLMQNESWVGAPEAVAQAQVSEDIAALCDAWFKE